MGTQNVEIDETWQQIAASTDTSFLIENLGTVGVWIHIGADAPAEGDGAHILSPREKLVRVVDGNVYAKSKTKATAALAVTVSGA